MPPGLTRAGREREAVGFSGIACLVLEVLKPRLIHPDDVLLIRLESDRKHVAGPVVLVSWLPGHLWKRIAIFVHPGPVTIHHLFVERDRNLDQPGLHLGLAVGGAGTHNAGGDIVTAAATEMNTESQS